MYARVRLSNARLFSSVFDARLVLAQAEKKESSKVGEDVEVKVYDCYEGEFSGKIRKRIQDMNMANAVAYEVEIDVSDDAKRLGPRGTPLSSILAPARGKRELACSRLEPRSGRYYVNT